MSRKGNSRLRSSVVSFMVSQLHLHGKQVPLSAVGIPHNKQADVFVAERIHSSRIRRGADNCIAKTIVDWGVQVCIAIRCEVIIPKVAIRVLSVIIIIRSCRVSSRLLFGIHELRRAAPVAKRRRRRSA
jgi:hypothetical protein